MRERRGSLQCVCMRECACVFRGERACAGGSRSVLSCMCVWGRKGGAASRRRMRSRAGVMLQPAMPRTADRLLGQLGVRRGDRGPGAAAFDGGRGGALLGPASFKLLEREGKWK